MSIEEDLRATVSRLEAAYEAARQHLEQWAPQAGLNEWGTEPYLVTDQDGRYILLEALIGLANAQTALLNAEQARPHQRYRDPPDSVYDEPL